MSLQLLSDKAMASQSLSLGSERILFVDDEPFVLDAIQRTLYGKFNIHTARSGKEAISRIHDGGGFAVVVSDYLMPGMDGVSLLKRVGEISPDSVRVLLTGQAHLEMSIRAVNEGSIFRLLLKPCATGFLERSLADALRQHHLIQAEREYYALQKWNQSLGGLVHAFQRSLYCRASTESVAICRRYCQSHGSFRRNGGTNPNGGYDSRYRKNLYSGRISE